MKVCRRCGKINQSMGNSGYCPACLVEERSDYENVRNYVRTHPNVSVMDAHMATGVSLKTIHRLIRNGDLTLKEGSAESPEN